MTAKGVSASFWELRHQPSDQCLPCLSDPIRRSSLGLKVALVLLHVVFVGAVFLLDGDLIEKTKTETWYTTLYLLLFVVALVQYFATAGASPGYLIDARRAFNEANTRIKECSASSKAWTCSYCSLEQPPRSKHCNELTSVCFNLIIIAFGLGLALDRTITVDSETALCLWTGILYMGYLRSNNISRTWWKDVIMILLLCILVFLLLLLFFHSYLVLTNQTTYELVRQRRISYLRGIPERVYPFSKGIRQNLYSFCCARGSDYYMERMPTQWELEELAELARPYTCLDNLRCRCC